MRHRNSLSLSLSEIHHVSIKPYAGIAKMLFRCGLGAENIDIGLIDELTMIHHVPLRANTQQVWEIISTGDRGAISRVGLF